MTSNETKTKNQCNNMKMQKMEMEMGLDLPRRVAPVASLTPVACNCPISLYFQFLLYFI